MISMDELTTLEGLGNITRIGQDSIRGVSIYLVDNPKLASAMALSNAKGTFTSDALAINGNPQLACVPEQWPAKDDWGDTIRNGKALHEPCLYQCDSAAHTCSQTATGTQSESACAGSCGTPPSSQTPSTCTCPRGSWRRTSSPPCTSTAWTTSTASCTRCGR